MSTNFIGPRNHPHREAWELATSNLIMAPSKRVDAALLTSVCVRASNGQPFFCRMHSAYRKRLEDVTRNGDVMAVEFLKAATVFEGKNRGKVAKYQHHARCQADGEKCAEIENGCHLRAVMYACTWGISQQPGFRIVENVDAHMRREYFARYLGDENMQMIHLINRLDNLIYKAHGGMVTALREFYEIYPAWHTESEVEKTLGLAQHYRSMGSAYFVGGGP